MSNKMNFKDISSNYNGKMIRADEHLNDTEVLEVSLYFSNEVKIVKNSYGVKYPEPTGFKVMKMNVTKMKKDGVFYTGGLGKTVVVKTGFKRQSLKALQDYASTLTVADVKVVGLPQTTEPSLVI